jgi:hypothetical protein
MERVETTNSIFKLDGRDIKVKIKLLDQLPTMEEKS